MKTILIVGANSNIGSFIANHLISENHRLILHYHHNKHRIESLLKHPSVSEIQFDLCDYLSIHNAFQKFYDESKEETLFPDSVIVCATERSSDFQKLADTDIRLTEKIIQTNLTGVCYLLNILLPYLRSNSASNIVLFGSNVSRIGLSQGSVYAATKAAISNLVRSLAKEEAEHNILINIVSPGPVQIDSTQFAPEYRRFREDYYERQIQTIPLNRLAGFNDIYQIVHFLIFKNSYMTGEEFYVTGGAL
ncbi:MAG: SDR family oxidoreductase [Candidatus Cloacimonetes bacterium]|nr:SDR family oxidoreductase [Candidatus Cloacimonadota bacterium]HPM00776.1 SDR family oxidoreductase [Candidatus Cloacimonadota bacterium]